MLKSLLATSDDTIQLKQYIIEHTLDHNIEQVLVELLCHACWAGSFESVKWLARTYNYDHRRPPPLFTPLVSACAGGHMHIAQWYVNTYNPSAEEAMADLAYVQACWGGHTDIIEWLLTCYTISDFSRINGFNSVCRYGYLELAKRLSVDPVIDASIKDANIGVGLISACIWGQGPVYINSTKQIAVCNWLENTYSILSDKRLCQFFTKESRQYYNPQMVEWLTEALQSHETKLNPV